MTRDRSQSGAPREMAIAVTAAMIDRPLTPRAMERRINHLRTELGWQHVPDEEIEFRSREGSQAGPDDR